MKYEILYEGGLSERDEFEMECKGYRSHVMVKIRDRLYPVCFYDPVRLAQDMEYEDVIGEPGLIVIKNVTKEEIEKAVVKLIEEGFFSHIVPLKE